MALQSSERIEIVARRAADAPSDVGREYKMRNDMLGVRDAGGER